LELTRYCSVQLKVEREAPTVDRLPQVLIELGGLHDATQETFWVVPFDSIRQIRTVVQVARGGYHTLEVPIPAVLSAVLLAGVDRFAVAHNHSAGDVRPTTIDVDLTAKLMDAANTVGLYFEDHLVLGPRGKAFSFAEEGLLIPSPNLGRLAAANRRIELPGDRSGSKAKSAASTRGGRRVRPS
jgi:DNA repair protein RadC